jgi:hypothetical protein
MRGQMTHLDTDVLAEFRAGLITGRRGTRIAVHLAGCDRCTALDDRLAGVSALLASVPAPAMPDRVAQRLDTVLAAEVARRDYPERTQGDSSRESGTRDRPAASRGFRLPLRVLAPVAVVVLAAGGYGVSRMISPGNPPAISSAGSAAAPPSSAASTSAASAGSAAKSAGGALVPAAGPRRVSAATLRVAISPTNFSSSPATLKRQVETDLGVPLASRTTQPASSLVRGCVQRVAGGHDLVRVESAHFEGRPATLIVARTGQHDTAWIAGPDCSATNPHVLAMTSVPSGISEP